MTRSLAMTMVITMGLPVTAVAQQTANEQDAYEQNRPRTQAQSQAQPGERREANFRGPDSTAEQSDQRAGGEISQELVNYLAARMMLSNQCEIEAASMAADKAESQDVKNLAKKIQTSHETLNQQLKQAMPGLNSVQSLSFAKSGASTARAADARPGSERDPLASADRQTDRQSSRDGRDAFLDGAAQRLIDIDRRTIENSHQMVSAELNSKQGAEFDRCFVAQQVGVHMLMLAELKAIRDTGPREFTSLVQQAESETQAHLDAAKQIAQRLEQQRDDMQAAGERANPSVRQY